MIDTLSGIALILATLAAGLLAGLFYSFSVSVMPGLARSEDRTFVQTMQQINIAIINPLFFFSFMGTPVLVGLAAVLHLGSDRRSVLIPLLLAFVAALGTLVITMALNVPLNNALDRAGHDLDRISDLAGVRKRFEGPWVRWNHIRTVTSTAALAFMAWALVEYGQL